MDGDLTLNLAPADGAAELAAAVAAREQASQRGRKRKRAATPPPPPAPPPAPPQLSPPPSAVTAVTQKPVKPVARPAKPAPAARPAPAPPAITRAVVPVPVSVPTTRPRPAPAHLASDAAGETFDQLGLDARLVAKLTAATPAAAASGAGSGAGDGPASAVAGVHRGHLREGFGLLRPTRVQRLVIPRALTGASLCVRSETGSGKTLAYLAPVVQRLLHTWYDAGRLTRADGTLAIVLAPTRELASQIFTVAARLLQACPALVPGLLSGGEKRKSEKARLRKGVHLLVATPGRLLDHLRGTAAFVTANLQALVLDEADRLLDMGFDKQVREIVAALHERRAAADGGGHGDAIWQSTFVSATLTPELKALVKQVAGETTPVAMVDVSIGAATAVVDLDSAPVNAEAATPDGAVAAAQRGSETAPPTVPARVAFTAPTTLTQVYMLVPLKWRLVTLIAAVFDAFRRHRRAGRRRERDGPAPPDVKIILFLSTTNSVDFHWHLFRVVLPTILAGSRRARRAAGDGDGGRDGFSVLRLHGNMEHSERVETHRAFAAAPSGLLIATDVASRGLDLPRVDLILQADAPTDTSDYVHRIGRTARRGESGSAILFLQPSEVAYAAILEASGLAIAPVSTAPMLASLTAAAPPLRLLFPAEETPPAARTARAPPAPEVSLPPRIQHLLQACEAAKTLQSEAGTSRRAELNAVLWQTLLEEAVLRSLFSTSAAAGAPATRLLAVARDAFISFVRAYATREKAVRHIFQPRSLHLGHAAKAFALREAPTIAVARARGGGAAAGGEDRDHHARHSALHWSSDGDSGGEAQRPSKQRRVVNEYDA